MKQTTRVKIQICRSKFHNIQITGEATSGDVEAAVAFLATLRAITERRNYPPELVFNLRD